MLLNPAEHRIDSAVTLRGSHSRTVLKQWNDSPSPTGGWRHDQGSRSAVESIPQARTAPQLDWWKLGTVIPDLAAQGQWGTAGVITHMSLSH